MNGKVISLPRLPAMGLDDLVGQVALNFRAHYAEDRVSERELEALGPVLPELVSELMAIMTLDSERE
jgi:hypothetical protein